MAKKLIAQSASIIALVAFTLWFAQDFHYEPFIGLVLSIAGFVGAEKYSGFAKLNKWDERLAQKFLKELPSSSSAIGILQDHDFNATFVYEYWKPLGSFYDYWKDPDHEFNNKRLRKKMNQYLSSFLELKKLVGQHTSPINGKPEFQKINEYVGEDIAEEMNRKASEAFKRYSEICCVLKKYDFEQ